MKNAMKDTTISGNHLREYFEKAGTNEKELAKLLNVNPTSLKRWAAPSEDAPTSTTFLVLLPLLLGAGVDIIPESDEESLIAVLERLGFQKDLRNSEKRKRLCQVLFAQMNEDMKAARRLFTALQKAWERIDSAANLFGTHTGA